MLNKRIQTLGLAVLLVLACCCQCLASSLQAALQQDFSPVEATIADVSRDHLVLDTGPSSRISTGDLFSIFQKGRPVYLPESHRILGYERKKIGICRISVVREDTSVCNIVSSVSTPENGDLAVRFGEMSAAFFIDAKPVEPELPEGSLKDILPWFKWLEPSAGPSPVPTAESMNALGIDILFQVRGDELKVYGPGMELLRSYKLPPSFVYIDTAGNPTQQGGMETEEGIQGIKLFDFKTARMVGQLDKEALQVQVCDLDGDGRLEIIYLLKDRICIAPYRRTGSVAAFKFENFACVCNFSLMEKSGWLCVNAALGQAGLSSKLLKYQQGTLRLVQDQINLWLAFLDSNCDGIKDTLLGQSYERVRFRGRKVFTLSATDSGIEYIEQADFPGDFNVNSAVQADFGQEGCSLFYVSFDGFFKVFGRGRHIWSSLKPVVRDTKCCGPSKADLINMSGTAGVKAGILFNGIITLPKGRIRDSLMLFSNERKAPALYQAEVNLKGSICGISADGDRIIMAVVVKTSEKPGTSTVLYEFAGQ